ncbi:hypothetical protein GCM10009096_02930 [Parasphingorhabdus litoris]|uniref:Cytochrome c domain-containing protein n=1 Tax=Parasphingorhabdus litoris TaxID=394733 RepID=A0ABN1A266_9SPHN|nr:hypothetical protein [Parasphingorhabdus litoris]
MKKLSLFLAAASVMVAAPALASGGGGGGGYSGGGFGASQPRDPRAAAFSQGKRAFKKRITCKKCEYKGGFTDGKTAREVAARVKAGEFNLKPRQRQAVLYYMSERYSIVP